MSESVETTKRFLKRYRKNQLLIARLEAKLETLKDRMFSVKSPTFSDMPRGGIPVTSADLVLEANETESRIERLKAKGLIIRAEILDKIDELEDVNQADILEAFCIDCKEFEDIAEEKGYSVRYVIALYSKAIENIIL